MVRPVRNEIERRGHNPLLFGKFLEANDAWLLGLIRAAVGNDGLTISSTRR